MMHIQKQCRQSILGIPISGRGHNNTEQQLGHHREVQREREGRRITHSKKMPLGQDDNHTEIPPTLVMGQFASKNGGVLHCTGWVLACQVLHLGETDKQYNGVARTLARGQNQSKGLIPTLTLVHYLATWAIPKANGQCPLSTKEGSKPVALSGYSDIQRS